MEKKKPGRPRKNTETLSVTVTIRLTETAAGQLDQLAEADHRTRCGMVQAIIMRKLASAAEGRRP